MNNNREIYLDIKGDFPVFERELDLVYLDHAATSQKPEMVVDVLKEQMLFENGSPHRGAHRMSVLATEIYNKGRNAVREFIHARRSEEIIFTKNATESLNLIAYSYGLHSIGKEDEILVAISAHHSNFVPWQMVAEKTGASLKYLMVDEFGDIPDSEISKINEKTKLVAFSWISNGIGTKVDVQRIIEKAHEVGAVAVVDAAQIAGHEPIDVQAVDADFLVFSGHKMFAPQGIGILYGKYDLLDKMPPFLTGGDMIEYVSCEGTTFAQVPERFEAGTQNVTGVRGLTAAIDYVLSIGLDRISVHESALTSYAVEQLKKLPFVTVYGAESVEKRGALVIFNIEGIHPHDVASILDEEGIAIRAGHHCTQPLMKHLGLGASCRASFSIYNGTEDIDTLVKGIKRVREVFGYDD